MLIMPSVFRPPAPCAIHLSIWTPKSLDTPAEVLLVVFVAVICALVLGVSGAFLYLSPNLPSVDSLRSVQLQIPSGCTAAMAS